MKQEQLYHCLSAEEWVSVTAVLTYSEVKILYYILTLNPMGDRPVDCRVRSIAEALTISTGSVSQGLRALSDYKLIEMEIIEASITVKPRLISFQAQKLLDRQKNKNVSNSEPLNDVHSTEHDVHSTEHDVHSTEHDVHSTEQAILETTSEQGFQESPTDHTNTDLNSYSLSDSEKKEKKNEVDFWISETETLPVTEQISNNSSLVIIKNPVEEKCSAPRTTNKTQSVVWNWLPDGPWKINGKLDPNFRDAIAHDWINRFGGEIHARRADVLTHFKKDPANLPIRWEQYSSEYLHRYKNTQTLLDSGLSIEPEYQQRLIENHRAITEPLSEELNPVAINVQCLDANNSDLIQRLDAQPQIEAPDRENSAAYQLWKPKEIEGEMASPEQVRELWQKLSKGFSMPQPQTPNPKPQTPIEELRLWIADPILRPEAMKRIMNSDRYTVEFDAYGNPISVISQQSTVNSESLKLMTDNCSLFTEKVVEVES